MSRGRKGIVVQLAGAETGGRHGAYCERTCWAGCRACTVRSVGKVGTAGRGHQGREWRRHAGEQ